MNLTDESYLRIRDYLLSDDVTLGTRLSINALSDQLGIGRSPVRDAVKRLAAEGLLESVARSGVTLKRISLAGLQDIVGLREALEPYAAQHACGRMHYEQHQRLRALCLEMGKLARKIRDTQFQDETLNRVMRTADWHFHQLILEASGNARLQKIIDDNHLLLCKVRYPSERTVRHLALTLLEHWRIYCALLHEQPNAARLWMLRHAQRGGQAMLKSWQDVYGGESR